MNRYGVHRVTGYGFAPTGRGPRTYWYVHDKVYCHNVVASFDGRFNGPEQQARRLCAKLNAEERAWERAGGANGA